MNGQIINYVGGLGLPSPVAYADGSVIIKRVRKGCLSESRSKLDADCGNIAKEFVFTKSVRRVVRAKASAMAYNSRKFGETLFFYTLTCVDRVDTNECVSRFFENLKKRKLVNSYLWVRELQLRGANHWHLVVSTDSKWLDYGLIKKAWNSALVSCGYQSSGNSVRFGDRPKIEGDVMKVVSYISKYMSKACKADKLIDRCGSRVGVTDIRVTSSSRIKYKGVIELDDIIDCQLSKSGFFKDYLIVLYYNCDVVFMRWLSECWNKSEYLSLIRENFINN